LTRPAFNYRAFVTRWRALAADHGIDTRTGEPLPVAGRPWWVQLDLWTEVGDNASVVEAEAFANIAAEVRRIAGVPEPETVADAVRAIWQEDGERRERQIAMPLRDLHAARGETVEMIVGVRMLVPVQKSA
jgi:hypothetical protein